MPILTWYLAYNRALKTKNLIISISPSSAKKAILIFISVSLRLKFSYDKCARRYYQSRVYKLYRSIL